MMPLVFLLLFPFVELWLLIRIGAEIGALSTILMLILAGVVGMQLLRLQGFSTLLKINEKLRFGEDASLEALEGMLLALSGALFLFPGFISDLIGIVFVIPLTRRLIIKRLLSGMVASPSVRFHSPRHNPFGQHDNIYEGEFREIDPEEKRLR